MKFSKIKLPFLNSFAVGLFCLIIGIGLGIAVVTVPVLAKFTLPKIAFLVNKISRNSAQNITKIDSLSDKKQKLETTYKEIGEAESKQDWAKLYSFVNPSDKSWLSLSDFILIAKSYKKTFSTEYVVRSINVEDNKGLVDRTVIQCATKECVGKDRNEESGIKEFVYLNDQWYQISTKAPSERAVKDAAYMYANSGDATKKKLADKYNGGVDDTTKIIHIWSIVLENNPELMAYDEALIDKQKANNSRPIVNVDPPTVIQQPASVIQQPNYPRNCTSSTIGNYTYTNCY